MSKAIPPELPPVQPNLSDPSTRNLDPSLERLRRFHPKGMDLSLGRMHRLLAALGHPERRLPPVFHVAGTNGKGSTVAFLRSILEASNLTVHAYTSPHLVKYNERIRIAGKVISDGDLAVLIDEVEAVNKDEPISFFEITTAMALHRFASVPADALLLETGLGGVLDATNVVERPAATAITRISYDHTHILGSTIQAIAGEKAGILKHGTPAILAWQREPKAREVIQARASAVGAPLFEQGRFWDVQPTLTGFEYRDEHGTLDLPQPALLGAHQLTNAGTAIAALRCSGLFAAGRLDFAAGMLSVDWPARLQRLTSGSLARMMPPGWELWLDGGHNDSGGEVLAMQALSWEAAPGALPLDIVFGMLSTKHSEAFLQPLAPHVGRLRGIEIEGEALSLSAEQAAQAARIVGIAAAPAPSIEAAINELAQSSGTPRRLLICGSLYLAGRVLAAAQARKS